jgi:putative transposase
LTALFKEYGPPQRIRTDNCVPFATNTLPRLAQLFVWWVPLGVLTDLIKSGEPQQNGRHARMHRPLKAETTRPPANSIRSQQIKFDHFRLDFNVERPLEALDMRTPVSCHEPSPRSLPEQLPPLEYPDRLEVRYVSAIGGSRGDRAWIDVSITRFGEHVGLEEVDDGIRPLSRTTDPDRRCLRTHQSSPVTVTHVPGLFCCLCPRLLKQEPKIQDGARQAEYRSDGMQAPPSYK